jgi:hypothetical protein
MIERIRELEADEELLHRMRESVVREAEQYRVDCHVQAYLDVYEQVKTNTFNKQQIC